MPTATASRAITMAFDVVRAQTRQATIKSSSWRSLGVALVTHRHSLAGTTISSAFWTSAVLPKVRTESPSASGVGALSSRVALRRRHQRLECLVGVARGDHDVGLRTGGDEGGHVSVHVAVERDDAAEGALRIGREGLRKGVSE